jgi:hypothetical protein
MPLPHWELAGRETWTQSSWVQEVLDRLVKLFLPCNSMCLAAWFAM